MDQQTQQASMEIVSLLLGVLARKGVKELSFQGMRIFDSGDGTSYQVECLSEQAIVESYRLQTPYEVVMLVLGNSWDLEFEAALETVLTKYGVKTPPEVLNTVEEARRILDTFRHATMVIVEGGFKEVPVISDQLPTVAPKEGELVDEEEEEDTKDYKALRKTKGNDVEYTEIKELKTGAVVTQVVLYPTNDAIKPVCFPDRQNVTADGVRLERDLDDVVFDRLMIQMSDGTTAMFQHHQDCCENVYIEDVEGDFMDLIGRPLVVAEEASHSAKQADGELGRWCDSETWTFYRFASDKGMIVVRWMGSSNGYYGESVSCDFSHGGKRENALGHDE